MKASSAPLLHTSALEPGPLVENTAELYSSSHDCHPSALRLFLSWLWSTDAAQPVCVSFTVKAGSRTSEKSKKAVKGGSDVDGLISERGGEAIHEALIILHDLSEIIVSVK